MVYTVQVTVKVDTASADRAYHVIHHALTRGLLDEEIIYVDAEVVASVPDEDEPQGAPV